jgi:hypothetical protein
MKTFRKFGIALMAVFAGLCMTACGDDDPDDGGDSNGDGGIVINNSTVTMNYAYYWSEGSEMHIEFYSWDVTSNSVPSKMSFLSIDYASTDNVPQTCVVASNKYSMYVVKEATYTSDGFQGECSTSDSKSDLKITRNGNTVSVNIAYANGIGGEGDNWTDDFSLSVNWSGSMSELPEAYRD